MNASVMNPIPFDTEFNAAAVNAGGTIDDRVRAAISEVVNSPAVTSAVKTAMMEFEASQRPGLIGPILSQVVRKAVTSALG